MSRCRRFLVSGRVQGVFFRASAQAEARKLNLGGWVRNLSDGGVELVACGEDSQLQKLEQWLWQGPPRARVSRVQTEEIAPQPFAEFSVRG